MSSMLLTQAEGRIPASASETRHSAGQQKEIFLTAASGLGAPHGGLLEVVFFCSELLRLDWHSGSGLHSMLTPLLEKGGTWTCEGTEDWLH